MANRKRIHSSGLTNTADKIPGMKKLPLLILLLLPLVAHAGWKSLFDLKPDEEKPWVEIESALPAYPARKNLIPFEVSAVTRNRHFIDAASVSVGKDDVVRYTVLVEAPGGVSNISYEGIRCGSGERRIYAFGHPDRTWSEARNTSWQEINNSGFSYQKALYDDYFCPGGEQVKDSAEALMNLRRAGR
jgi:hypothetical protein